MICAIGKCENQVEVGICSWHQSRLARQLSDLMELWSAAHGELIPGRGGSGGSSNEQSIGINVSALSFIAGTDILGLLHEWEKEIRSERGLTPPALVKRQPGLGDEIKVAVEFALTHLPWSSQQSWIGDFADELGHLHAMGRNAAKVFADKVARIPCPADDRDGLPCGQNIYIKDGDLMAIFSCPKCHSDWTALRLVAVAISAGSAPVLLDPEAIGHLIGMTSQGVVKFAKRHCLDRQGLRYDLREILTARNVA